MMYATDVYIHMICMFGACLLSKRWPFADCSFRFAELTCPRIFLTVTDGHDSNFVPSLFLPESEPPRHIKTHYALNIIKQQRQMKNNKLSQPGDSSQGLGYTTHGNLLNHLSSICIGVFCTNFGE